MHKKSKLAELRSYSVLLWSRDIEEECARLTGQAIPGPGERVHVVNDWIHTLIMERRKAGGLGIPAPLLTRMFSIMSQGMEGYENCRCGKVATSQILDGYSGTSLQFTCSDNSVLHPFTFLELLLATLTAVSIKSSCFLKEIP